MLKKIFGSGARVKLLKQFLLNGEDEFYIRELTRILDEQINSLRRELENLEKIGLLKSVERNRKKYYRINKHFSLLPELTSIFRKEDDSNKALLKDFNTLGNVYLVVLSGIFIQDSQLETDVLLVGEDVDKAAVGELLAEKFPDVSLKYTVFTKQDFLYRLALNDKFIRNVFAQKQNIILKNKLKKDTEALVAL
ncbi:hypothetical protein CSB37_03915 [bacterium DOLZORAL124_38_8]|nr:MAG: hypothetical protein CSB37_03915 [bacterium DOLZORAL124_38_8]